MEERAASGGEHRWGDWAPGSCSGLSPTSSLLASSWPLGFSTATITPTSRSSQIMLGCSVTFSGPGWDRELGAKEGKWENRPEWRGEQGTFPTMLWQMAWRASGWRGSCHLFSSSRLPSWMSFLGQEMSLNFFGCLVPKMAEHICCVGEGCSLTLMAQGTVWMAW